MKKTRCQKMLACGFRFAPVTCSRTGNAQGTARHFYAPERKFWFFLLFPLEPVFIRHMYTLVKTGS